TGRDVYASRVSPAGVALDPAGIVIADSAIDELAADVVWGGGVFLVVWTTSTSACATRLSPTGQRLDSTPLWCVSAVPDTRATSTWLGNAFLVAWSKPPAGVMGTLILPDGTVTNPSGVQLSLEDSAEEGIQLASDSSGHALLAYTRSID